MAEPIITTRGACEPYQTNWYQGGGHSYTWDPGTGWSFVQNPAYSTGRPRDPDGLRGRSWGPERDDLDSRTCSAHLTFRVAWWWRRRWACALNGIGTSCVRLPWHRRWTWRERVAQHHASRGRLCEVDGCRPGNRETTLDFASCEAYSGIT